MNAYKRFCSFWNVTYLYLWDEMCTEKKLWRKFLRLWRCVSNRKPHSLGGLLASAFQTLGSEFESLLWHKRIFASLCVCVVLCRYRLYDCPIPLQRALPDVCNRRNGRTWTALVCRAARKHKEKKE